MADEFDVKVVGLHETVKALKDYEPAVLKALQKDMKGRLKPLARAVGLDFPKYPPSLNGNMHWIGVGRYKKTENSGKGSGFPKWDGLAQNRVIISSSTSSKRSFARVQQMSPSGAVFDSAKKSKTKGFIQALDFASDSVAKGGKTRSRVMFGSTKKHLPMVEKEIEVILDKLGAEIERKLGGF